MAPRLTHTPDGLKLRLGTFRRRCANHNALTIHQKAELTGLSVATISRIESGETIGHARVIVHILHALPEATYDELFEPAYTNAGSA